MLSPPARCILTPGLSRRGTAGHEVWIWSQVPKLSPSKPAMGTPTGRTQAQRPVLCAFWPPKYTPPADGLLPPMVLGQLTE